MSARCIARLDFARLAVWWGVAGGLLLSGCATHYDRVGPVRDAFFAGDLTQAEELLDKHRDLRLRDHDCKELDRAMIELAAGRPQNAERILREVRNKFDEFEEKSIAEAGASMLTDDNIKAYPGEDYERVLIRAFLALSNLMTTGDDAAAYALQVTEKQNQVIELATDRHKEEPESVLAYKQVALGPYVRAMLAEESPLTLDDAAKARLQVANWAPGFREAKADLQRAQHEVPIKPGMGVLYVFTLVGRGPVKEQVAELPTQAALLIADRIVSANSNRGLPPTLAPVLVPQVKTFVSSADMINVSVDGRPAGQTSTLMEIGVMAESQFNAKFPHIVAQAVARRVIKKGVIYGLKDVADTQKGSLPSIALDALGVAWEATEVADTRCWGLLPDKIQVLRVELPAGDHRLTLQPARPGGPIGRPVQTNVRIHAGHNAYVLGTFPDAELVGELLVSGQARISGTPAVVPAGPVTSPPPKPGLAGPTFPR
ncbi:MAG TPA: hypothetical protein VHB77_04625 [Planctomycetaceae bacterium]|nr:hypothetical protein [Planctomycetaceae bacterium]